MKKTLKTIIAGLTIVAMSVALSGCSSLMYHSSTNSSTNSSTDSSTSSTDSGGSTASGTESGETVKSEFASGNGTESSPYVISQDYQWQNISSHLSSYFSIQSDLYLDDLGTITPIGSSSSPFEGVIEGNNHTIYNAVIAQDDESGLFGCISGGEVKNLNFEDSSVKLNVTGDGAYVGSFAANLKKGALIENCHTDNITMTEVAHGNILGYPEFYAAGFVGIVQSASKVIYCSCDVVSNAKGNRVIYIAGFVGKMNGGEIDACSCAGSFDPNPSTTGGGTPANKIGGFVYTFAAGSITNVYTETLFNYVKYAGMFTYENMDELNYILSFAEFGNTTASLGTKMYYKADIVNNTIELNCHYYEPDRLEYSNDILDSDSWSGNKIWVKGKIHPVFVSYTEYVQIKAQESQV